MSLLAFLQDINANWAARKEAFILVYYFISQVTVGTNPISVAAPGKDGDSFVLDMATSSVALGKVSACACDTVC